MMKRAIPSIFYDELRDGLDFFTTCLGFKVLFLDESLAVIERDGAKFFLMQDAERAYEERPQVTIEVDSIEAIYEEIASAMPAYLHPDLNVITPTSWGGREFAVRDVTGVCVFIRQLDRK